MPSDYPSGNEWMEPKDWDSTNNVRTNNCSGNVDYSPLAPTDKLNVSVSPAIATALTAAAITAVVKDPVTAAVGLGIALPSIMVGDSVRGEPSISVSITGHDGDTYGYLEFVPK